MSDILCPILEQLLLYLDPPDALSLLRVSKALWRNGSRTKAFTVETRIRASAYTAVKQRMQDCAHRIEDSEPVYSRHAGQPSWKSWCEAIL